MFLQVFNANLDMLQAAMNSAVEHQALRLGNAVLTEDQVRRKAADYFNAQLARQLYQRIDY